MNLRSIFNTTTFDDRETPAYGSQLSGYTVRKPFGLSLNRLEGDRRLSQPAKDLAACIFSTYKNGYNLTLQDLDRMAARIPELSELTRTGYLTR